MTQLAAKDDHQDKLMGEQLSAEFKEAVNGMWRVVRVGAMMMALRQRLVSKLDTTRLPTAKASDGGIKAWLEQYAPDVERTTAYRFEDVTRAVAKSFELPARVAKKLTFEQIVTAPESELDEAALKVRQQINGFVAGTSQKSWLDQFKEMSGRGGDTSGSRKKLTPAEELKKFLEEAKNDFATVFESLDRIVDSGSFKATSITDPMLDASIELALEYAKQARAWRKTPHKDRPALTTTTEGAK